MWTLFWPKLSFICMFSASGPGLFQLNLQTFLLTKELVVKVSMAVCCGFLKVGVPLTKPKVGQVKVNIWPALTKLCYCIWERHHPFLVRSLNPVRGHAETSETTYLTIKVVYHMPRHPRCYVSCRVIPAWHSGFIFHSLYWDSVRGFPHISIKRRNFPERRERVAWQNHPFTAAPKHALLALKWKWKLWGVQKLILNIFTAILLI